jgi:CRISPR-associated endonuclease/helicase Cas3
MNDGLKQFYAHSLPSRPPSEWQGLEDHLKSVADLARKFAEPFGAGDWTWNAGWLHDVGKAAQEFQAYLLRENGLDDSEYDISGGGRVNHSSAGAAQAEDTIKGIPGRTLAYLSSGHHAGLPDWFTSETGNAALSIRLEEGRTNLARIRTIADVYGKNLKSVVKPSLFVKSKNYHLWVRMLYSCLVDSDFLDTEAFMQPDHTASRIGFASLVDLKTKFDAFMIQKVLNSVNTPVNATRQEILAT